MPPDDLTIEATFRPGELLGSASDADAGLPENPSRFLRAIAIGVPIALLMWAGIGFAIFRALVRH